MSDNWEITLLGAAIAGGIVLAIVVSLLIHLAEKRGRFTVFGWLETAGQNARALTVFASNRTRRDAVITGAGIVRKDGTWIPGASHQAVVGRLPVRLAPDDLTAVCVIALRSEDTAESIAACYVIREMHAPVLGPIYERRQA